MARIWQGDDDGNAQGFFIDVEHLLAHPAMREPHLSVIGYADDDRFLVNPRVGLQCVKHGANILVHHFVEVGVEVYVVELLVHVEWSRPVH